MDNKTNYAVFVDLENAGGKATTLSHIIDKVKLRGDILIGRVYGYTDAYAGLKELLLSNTFSVVPSLRWGHNQKNNLDIQLVIDALEVAYKNELIDCFCIVSGDSDYTPLVGKLKSMGKFVLGISRSEAASGIFINACNEFVFLESVSANQEKTLAPDDDNSLGTEQLVKLIETVLADQANESGMMFASELKNVILRLRPEFNEKNYGFSSFSKLINHLREKYKTLRVQNDNSSLLVGVAATESSSKPTLTADNWISVFAKVLRRLKDEGFERVNPSILKATITNDYPDFDERQVGCKRFSDILKKLEKEQMLTIEMNETKDMLVRIR